LRIEEIALEKLFPHLVSLESGHHNALPLNRLALDLTLVVADRDQYLSLGKPVRIQINTTLAGAAVLDLHTNRGGVARLTHQPGPCMGL